MEIFIFSGGILVISIVCNGAIQKDVKGERLAVCKHVFEEIPTDFYRRIPLGYRHGEFEALRSFRCVCLREFRRTFLEFKRGARSRFKSYRVCCRHDVAENPCRSAIVRERELYDIFSILLRRKFIRGIALRREFAVFVRLIGKNPDAGNRTFRERGNIVRRLLFERFARENAVNIVDI